MTLGFDIGEDIICARREGDSIKYKKERNSFSRLPLGEDFERMKKEGMKLIERPKTGYIIGGTYPTIKDGTLNIHEKDSFMILKIIIHSMIERSLLYYCVSGDTYYEKILESIFKGYDAYPINVALALVYAELPNKTGLGVVYREGKLNYCNAYCGQPIMIGNNIDDIRKMKYNELDIVCPQEFEEYLAPLGNIIKQKDPFALARGALIAAENHT